ncbi:MAG: NAD-dependent epimerase/dehydratase family protein [Bacteroidetes bacterium]|nr:NAD-dependent epimerase/dehydratase family protein [Bacteroidota bacterium]
MRYFLTGATGFIGRRLAVRLLENGHDVSALVRKPHEARDLKALGADIFQGDITDRNSIAPGMQGADGIFHIAAKYQFGLRSHGKMESVNVGGTRNVLQTMRELRISKGVYTSSIIVNSDTKGTLVDETYQHDGPHLSEYARTKWEAHYRVAKSMIFEGLPLVIVLPASVYGPGDTSSIALMFKDFLRRRLPMIPSKAALSWVHVDDVVSGHVLAMEKGTVGESYILSGPTHTLVEALDEAARITRRRPPPIHLGPAMMRLAAKFSGVLEPVINIPSHYSAEALASSAGTTIIASFEKAQAELGYEPRDLRQGLKGTLTDLASRISDERETKHRRR